MYVEFDWHIVIGLDRRNCLEIDSSFLAHMCYTDSMRKLMDIASFAGRGMLW